MLDLKSLRKYVLYALGEIILVVIGILIALAINNYNQRHQSIKHTSTIGQEVLDQVNADLASITRYEIKLDKLDHGFRKALNRPYDPEKIDNDALFVQVFFQLNDLTIDERVIHLIDTNMLASNEISEIMYALSSSYKMYINYMEEVEDIILEEMRLNMKHIETTQDWYIDFVTDRNCKTDCVNYFRNDQGNKARMASMRLLYMSSYGQIISNFKTELEILKSKLASNLKNRI